MLSRTKVLLTACFCVGALLAQACAAEVEEPETASARPIEPCSAGSCLNEAMSLFPGFEHIAFGDRGGAAQRLGLDELSPDEAVDTYAADFDSIASSPLAADLGKMAEGGAAFTELDVRWWMTLGGESTYRMVDGLDLDAVANDLLDAGYTESEVNGHRRFAAHAEAVEATTGLVGGRYPWPLLEDLTLLPQQHVIVSSSAPDQLTAAIDGDKPALGSYQGFAELLTVKGDPEYAEMVSGERYLDCHRPMSKIAHNRLTPDLAAELSAELGYDQLGAPTARVFEAVPSADGVETYAVSVFEDARTARSDAKGREKFLHLGDDDPKVAAQRDPVFWKSMGDYTIDVRGQFEIVEHEFGDGASTALAAFQGSDVFAACGGY